MRLNAVSPGAGAKRVPETSWAGFWIGTRKDRRTWAQGTEVQGGVGACVGDLKAVRCHCNVDLPKFGFTSRKSLVRADLRVASLEKLADVHVSLESLRVSGLIRKERKVREDIRNRSVEAGVSSAGNSRFEWRSCFD